MPLWARLYKTGWEKEGFLPEKPLSPVDAGRKKEKPGESCNQLPARAIVWDESRHGTAKGSRQALFAILVTGLSPARCADIMQAKPAQGGNLYVLW